MTPVVAQTNRLNLRQFEPDDLDDLTEVLGNADVMTYSLTGPLTHEEVQEHIRRYCAHWHRWGYGLCAVVHRTDGKVIGYCGLQYFDEIDGRPEIEVGYRLNRDYWDCGYASEAAAAIVEFGFAVLGLERIIAMIDPRNLRSGLLRRSACIMRKMRTAVGILIGSMWPNAGTRPNKSRRKPLTTGC
jgi:RimJ/RimL family protein N-acetyltransferase